MDPERRNDVGNDIGVVVYLERGHNALLGNVTLHGLGFLLGIAEDAAARLAALVLTLTVKREALFDKGG